MIALLDPRLWLAFLLALAVAYGGGRWQQSRADAARYEAERMKAALSSAVDQAKAVDRARTEEQRRTAAQTEIANAATKDLERARGDARTADASAERLRIQLAHYVAAKRASGDPAPASASASANGPGDLLADLFLESIERNRRLAEYADAAHIAGQACVRAYDALTPK